MWLSSNKELNEVLFEEIKKNAKKNNNTVITPKIFHCDFEKDISNTAKKKVFPDINIKTWRYKRALEIKKNKLCKYFEITYLKDYEIKH
ncbi:hypothetical protein H8356DRAFT_1277654 [Neocallimastix lanati (nom. inval.)]|nr:hypothetical protein H8356DRAFT_1277654 [Neocallimastix sp. JGI-2020a]